MASSLPRPRDRNRSSRGAAAAPAKVAPCVPTGCVSDSSRGTRTPPGMPASSRRSRQRRDHAGRGAVAEACARSGSGSRAVPCRCTGLSGAHQERARVDVVGRRELELAEQVAPVGRQHRERGVPRRRERARRIAPAQPARRRRTTSSSRPADAFLVDPAQHSSHRFGSDTGAAARRDVKRIVVARRGPGLRAPAARAARRAASRRRSSARGVASLHLGSRPCSIAFHWSTSAHRREPYTPRRGKGRGKKRRFARTS